MNSEAYEKLIFEWLAYIGIPNNSAIRSNLIKGDEFLCKIDDRLLLGFIYNEASHSIHTSIRFPIEKHFLNERNFKKLLSANVGLSADEVIRHGLSESGEFVFFSNESDLFCVTLDKLISITHNLISTAEFWHKNLVAECFDECEASADYAEFNGLQI